MWSKLKSLFGRKSPTIQRQWAFAELYERMGGFYPQGDEENFRKALTHASFTGSGGNNFEQLEFLGDAMLNAVVAELLYLRFPNKREGELTKLRAWMVSRRQLNVIAKKIGIQDLVFHGIGKKRLQEVRHMEGNVLEAIIGAYYLDGGFGTVKEIVKRWLFTPEMLEEALAGSVDPISILYEWSQKKRRQLRFEHKIEATSKPSTFEVSLWIDSKMMAQGAGRSKKDAERDAAAKAVRQLGL